ncbi:MAG TPA: bi-domain-containing oxidoreductase, partial [Terriglobales bacterium]|nr:bi-domain-containing oxidoreductase [Terriglobales bacterium]
MKQIVQSARTGKIAVAEVPAPRVKPGRVLVKIAASIVSAGTERAAAEFASKTLIGKARSRPDLVREVLNKVRRDGILSAVSAVHSRLDQPIALGYSSAGTVIEVGAGIEDLKPGDRVACAGAGFAAHAEFACVPRMLVARTPSADIDFDSAAFATLGAVALHAVRTAEAKLGEVVAIIGLGLLGQLTVQILRAAGCVVIGIDPVPERAALAVRMGATAATTNESEFRDFCLRHSNNYGADSVLITAETASDGPVNLASEVARDRAIVVAVGAIGMQLSRRLYYEKELDFRVSRSYGPGRYDSAFEQKGRDYPIGHVRWSETRNLEAFLQLLAENRVNVAPLISHRFPIADATSAYDLITGKIAEPYLGVLLHYQTTESDARTRLELVRNHTHSSPANSVRIGMLGAGDFASGVLLPAIKKSPVTDLVGICASSGIRAQSMASKFAFEYCTTDEEQIFSDDSLNTVVIATRHHVHAAQIIRALESGKNVFCEKPLCLTEDELHAIQQAYSQAANSRLIVGFNRRFAPMVVRMKTFLLNLGGPFTMTYRINAGQLPRDHWTTDPEIGGGRILGELCHFVDLLSFLCGSEPTAVDARSAASTRGQDVIATIEFENQSIATTCYACSGDRALSKERIEVFGNG